MNKVNFLVVAPGTASQSVAVAITPIHPTILASVGITDNFNSAITSLRPTMASIIGVTDSFSSSITSIQPTLSIGATTTHAPPPTSGLIVNVRDKGATGNGSTNDTAAIQSAINQVGGTGGTVLVPDGTYMIDAVTNLQFKSNMTFQMTGSAILKAITNDQQGYNIIAIHDISNVNVIGGTVQGERATHTGVGGEWGMGVDIYNGSHIFVENVLAKDCWGDGFYIGGVGSGSSNVTLWGVVSDNNRRQGLSIVGVDGAVIRDSTFKNTNGTAPQAGIDIEPNSDSTVNNVLILNNKCRNNAVAGITMNGTNSSTTNVIIDGNDVAGPSWGIGVQGIGTIVRNNIVATNYIGIQIAFSGQTVINNTVCAFTTPIKDNGSGNTVTGNITSTTGCNWDAT